MNRFSGKRIVVTGTGSGIGRAVAERLAAEGGSVMCLDISGDGAEATAANIRAAGGISGRAAVRRQRRGRR